MKGLTVTLGIIIIAMSTIAISYLVVFAVRHWATERMLDVPNSRSSHSAPIVRGGGLGIVMCTLGGLVFCASLRLVPTPPRSAVAYCLAGGIIALMGWLDDLYSLPSWTRFLVQTICSIYLLFAMGCWQTVSLPFIGLLSLNWLGVPITMLWIVGLTNAYNFMDGIDGIAGGQAVVAGSSWVIMGVMTGQPFIGLIGLLLGASSLGFLFHNWPPAKIFMGDVGSAFIGFTLAVLPVIAGQKNPRFLVAGFMLVWPFIFDTSFTLARRLTNKENIFVAHRSHIYQRLVIAGHSHRFVTALYMGLSSIGALIAFLWYKDVHYIDAAVLFVPSLLFAGLLWLTAKTEARVRSRA